MGDNNHDESARVTELRDELDKAYETINSLTAMLETAMKVIERLSEGKIAVTEGDLALGAVGTDDQQTGGSPYVGADDVAQMFDCSKATANKHLRQAGAASIGHKLIAKRSTMIAYAESIGARVV